jgi:erythromycin esterase
MSSSLRTSRSRRHAIGVIALGLAAFSPNHGVAQTATARPTPDDPLNLGFERAGIVTNTTPERWFAAGQGYTVVLDDAVAHSGHRSLRSQATPSRGPNGFGVATMSLPPLGLAGRMLTLRGYIRTENVAHGYAGLWLRIDAGTKTVGFDNMSTRGATGTTPWTPYAITLRVDPAATNIIFGALHPGDGTAWFDSFSLEVDGHPYSEIVPTWHATADEAKWVHDRAIPLTTTAPDAPFDDLRPVGNIVGDARIVALGEGTHGTSEFFQMKHRLTRYLAQTKGFSVFAIEANMPEARRVNEYVLTGRGDPKAALAGLYFWTWNTQEVLDLIEWMRSYNASGKGHIEFWGFDMQTPDVAMDSVRAFVLRADSAYVPTLDGEYAGVADALREWRANSATLPGAEAVTRWEGAASRVVAHLEARRDAYVAGGQDSLEVAWAIQNARILIQAARSPRSPTSRDSSMAANVEWIAAHQPAGTKMVLWAHNGHVARSPASAMGAHLAARYGDALRVFGFALGDGNFTAQGPRGLGTYPAASPQPGSLEAIFRETQIPRFALDLRDAGARPASAFLTAPHDFRSVGALAMDSQFFPTPLASRFDVVLYFDHTKPSTRLTAQSGPR